MIHSYRSFARISQTYGNKHVIFIIKKKICQNINILTNFFLNNEDNMLVPIRLADSGKRPVTMYHKTIYAQLNKLSSAILEEMEKYKMDE